MTQPEQTVPIYENGDVDVARYLQLGGVDDTEGFNAAAVEARATGRGLYLKPGIDVRIHGVVNLRYIKNLTILPKIRVGPEGMIIIGGHSAQSYYADINIQNVEYLDWNTQTNVTIRLVGLKRSNVRIGQTNYLQLYADGNVEGDKSSSYLTFIMNYIGKLEFYGRDAPAPDPPAGDSHNGWLTEMVFIGGYYGLITVDSEFTPGNMMFVKPCCEGGEIRLPKGRRFYFLDARGESATSIWFGPGTERNVWEDGYTPNTATTQPGAVVMEDLGFENVVTTTFESQTERRTLAYISGEDDKFDGFTNIVKVGGMVRAKSSDYIFDTGLIELSGSAFYSDFGDNTRDSTSWNIRRFSISTDTYRSMRYEIYCYDESGEPLEDSDFLNNKPVIPGSFWNSILKCYQSSTSVTSANIVLPRDTVHYVRIKLKPALDATPFGRLDISAFMSGPTSDYPVAKMQRLLAGREENTCYADGRRLRVNGADRSVEYLVTTTVTEAPSAGVATVLDPARTMIGQTVIYTGTDGFTRVATVAGIAGGRITLTPTESAKAGTPISFYQTTS